MALLISTISVLTASAEHSPLPRALPTLAWNSSALPSQLLALESYPIEVILYDPEASILRVEFLLDTEVLSVDSAPPYEHLFQGTAPGTYELIARAYNTAGETALSEVLTLNVISAATGKPEITQPIPDRIVPEGSDLILDPGTTGQGPISYQWFLNGERLPEAQQATFQISPAVSRETSGSYQLRAENEQGVTHSDPILVSVDWPILNGADNLSEAPPLIGRNGFIRTSNVNATLETGEPNHGHQRGGRSIWYRWRPDTLGLARISLRGSSFDTLLSVYIGSDFTNLIEVDYDDDRGGFATSALAFMAVGGVEYLIAIDGLNEASGNVLLSWALDTDQLVAVPTIHLPVDKLTVNAGEALQLSSSLIGNLQGVNLQWVHNGTPITGANIRQLDLTAIEADDVGAYWIRINAGGYTARTEYAYLSLNLPTRRGVVRDLVLEEKFGALVQTARPTDPIQPLLPLSVNDRKSFYPTASSLVTGFTGAQIFNTFGATKEQGEPDHCGIPGGASQWFAYEAPADGQLILTTDGSDFDTVLGVYTASGTRFSDLTEVACDNNGGKDGEDSRVDFPVTSGTVYFVAVDGVNGVTGTVQLNYELQVGIHIQNLGIQELGLQFEIKTQPNLPFIIEASEDFLQWDRVLNTRSETGSFLFTDNEALVGTMRFYRVDVHE